MFARVITAQAGTAGIDSLLDLTEQQISVARQRPGFKAFYLLADDETGNLITISFWEGLRWTCERSAAGRYC